MVAITLSENELRDAFAHKHGDLSRCGWTPRLHADFGYFNPDDHYEAMVAKLVGDASRWLDVGCGASPFPSNPKLAFLLAARCALFAGVDPAESVRRNPFVHRRYQVPLDEFRADPFDVVTLRMVVEHVERPRAFAESLARLTRVGGHVVVYTVNKWSPVPIVSRWVPHRLHHGAKNMVWDVAPEDTFRVWYRMNTRRALSDVLGGCGFIERYFERVDDCRSSGRHRVLRRMELSCRSVLRRCALRYPENCLLAVYERTGNA